MISIDQKEHKSHDLKASDIDLDDSINSLPDFSIREYVFSLRNKDISCNWPFTSTSFQLCLKHGVKNLLPPFHSLDSLRNNSSLGGCYPDNCLTSQEHVSKPTGDQFRSNKEIVSTSSSGSKRDKESQFHPQRHSGQTKSKDKPPATSQKPENASVNNIMISKVCPVCKTFSSSSNTKLNAHIDQCLTGEGTMKCVESPKVVVKHKVKQRKMRLMLDIYKTASHCTVEELDRRNGTSWATNSSFAAQECQFQEEEEEKEEPRLTKVNPAVADNEGDVYIDTNGTKVRVLSVPKTGSSDNHGSRKSLIMCKKKNSLYKKKPHKKYLKLSQDAGKLCLLKPQARSQREDVVAKFCSKDEQSKKNKRVVDLGIIRPPWACSKRTGVSKKLNEKIRKVGLRSHRTKDSVVENHDKSFAGCRKKVGTSLSLNKQPINLTADCRKKVTSVNYDDDDIGNDNDSSQSQHSDDDDNTRSNVSKFSSLSKNVSFPVVKFCFKRKFSAFDESPVKFVGGPSHDSSKEQCTSHDSSQEQCRTEEYDSEKKKQESKSITSKSTSNEESLAEIQTANKQSVRNETSSSIPATSFTGLSTSFDPEFPTHECFELYQDQLCSTNSTLNDVDKQDKYFQKVDPIPIPGPPGSFLPSSPGGETVSEVQIQAISVHTMDHDSMSNSPVSTVSNSISSCGKDDTFKKPLFDGDIGFTESGQSHKSFKNDQPCCCSRKEAALNYKDMHISRKQPVESNMSTPDMFSVSNYPNPSAADSTVSHSKPILRLMGKNLTVVKTDEYEFRPPLSSQQPPLPANLSQYQNDFESQHFSVPNRLEYQSINGRNVYSGAMQNRFSKDSYGHMNRSSSGSLVFRGGIFQTSSANEDAAGKWNIGRSTTYYP